MSSDEFVEGANETYTPKRSCLYSCGQSTAKVCSNPCFQGVVLFIVVLAIVFPLLFFVILDPLSSSSSSSPPFQSNLTFQQKWRDRSIYFLLQDRFACDNSTGLCPEKCSDLRSYCGGTYDGIVTQLDYIQTMGFDAIWITPIPEQSKDPVAGEGYHGYYAKNLYELNPHFGTEDSLLRFIKECHKRNIYVMLDIVGNHMGPFSNEIPVESFIPFDNLGAWYHNQCTPLETQKIATYPGDYNYPGYSQDLFERCWLYTLPDLRTDIPEVQNILNDWINRTINKFDFDAIRIDTVPYVPLTFWQSYTQASGVFSIGEISGYNWTFCASYQNEGAMTSTLNYPAYFYYKAVWMDTPRSSMTTLSEAMNFTLNSWSDVNVLGIFIDNHDTPRALDLMKNDTVLLRNALSYAWFLYGIPILYYGTEQALIGADETYSDVWGSCVEKAGGDPCNREVLWPTQYNQSSTMYVFVSAINNHRKGTKTNRYPFMEIIAQTSFYAYVRGPALVLTTNVGMNGTDMEVTLNLTKAENTSANPDLNLPNEKPLPSIHWLGLDCINIFNNSDIIHVASDGIVSVTLTGGLPKVYYPIEMMTILED